MGGISPKTIINIKNMLHAAFNQAAANGHIQKNITEYIQTPKQLKKEMRVLTDTEFHKLIDTRLPRSATDFLSSWCFTPE